MRAIRSRKRRTHRGPSGRGGPWLAGLVAGLALAVVSSLAPAVPATGSAVPGPPQNVWLEWDLETMTVYLDANPDGLAVESLIRLETVPSDPATTQERRVPPSSGAWFDGLELGRTYAVTVWAVSADGTLSEPVVPAGSPFTVAPPVQSLLEVTATATAPDTIEVTWVTNPEAPPPQAFMVDIRKDPSTHVDGHVEEGIPGSARSFTWSDAEPATTYEVSVAVSDPPSPFPSGSTTVTTPEAGPPPPAPLAVTATVAGATMTVAWTPDDSGPSAERYRVRASSEQCESVGTWAAGTSTSTDLAVQRDCLYAVTVAALAADGASSGPVEAAGSPVYVPFEPPLDVEAVAISAHRVVVRWRTAAPPEAGQRFHVRFWAPDGTDLYMPWATEGTEVTTGWWDAGTTLVARVASCGVQSGMCGPWLPDAGVSVTLPADVTTMTGRVTAPDGTPLAGAAVWAFAEGDTWRPSAIATTGTDGTYALVDAPSARYTIRVQPPAGSPLAPHWYPATPSRSEAASVLAEGGLTYSDLDVAFTTPRSVTGRVTREGAPVAGALVMAFAPADRWIGSFRTTTAADGTYTLDRLGAVATYRIVAIGPEGSSLEARWYPGTGRRPDATPVDTTAGPVDGIDIDWPAGSGISGVVTGPGGVPLAGATVTAYRPTDRYVGTVGVTTAADGSYSIDRLDPGTYRLLVHPRAGSGTAACWHAGVLKRTDATSLTFTGAPLTGIDTSCPAG